MTVFVRRLHLLKKTYVPIQVNHLKVCTENKIQVLKRTRKVVTDMYVLQHVSFFT